MTKPKSAIIEGDSIHRLRAATADELIQRGFLQQSYESNRNLSTKYTLTKMGEAYFAWNKPGRFSYTPDPDEAGVEVSVPKHRPYSVKVFLEDLEWWAKSTGRARFTQALHWAKKTLAKKGSVTILWDEESEFHIS